MADPIIQMKNIEKHFGLKLHLLVFAMTRPAHCKMGGGRCSSRRGIQFIDYGWLRVNGSWLKSLG